MIEIQSFDRKFEQGIAELIVPIQQDEFGIAITYQDQPDLQDIPGFYQKGAGNFWVASDDGKVVGSVGLLDIGDNQAALRKMFVAPAYRGKEHGVAARLLNILLEHARAAKLQAIFLGTTDKFLSAHRFYEKNGFSRIEADTLPVGFPRMAVDTIFYKYNLT